jgi:hypothetical protein
MAKNTTPTLPVYVQELSLEDIARRGGAIGVWVHGYWGDVITIYVNRKVKWSSSISHLPYDQHPVEWEFTMSHSSGGRSKDEVADDLEAEANFAMGLMAAVQHARTLRSQSAELEKAYRRHEAAEEARAEEKKAAEQAEADRRLKLDTELGLDAASEMVTSAISSCTRRQELEIHVYEMGAKTNEYHIIRVRRGADDRVRFFRDSTPVAAGKMPGLLATKSHRTCIL